MEGLVYTMRILGPWKSHTSDCSMPCYLLLYTPCPLVSISFAINDISRHLCLYTSLVSYITVHYKSSNPKPAPSLILSISVQPKTEKSHLTSFALKPYIHSIKPCKFTFNIYMDSFHLSPLLSPMFKIFSYFSRILYCSIR